jgi:hypothetical protein
MKSSCLQALALCLVTCASFFSLSCGSKQELVSITLSPDKVTFLGIGATAQLTALGNYIHPPATKDITSEVTWSTDGPTEVTVNNGLVTAINVCGGADVIASLYSNPSNHAGSSVVRGSSTVTIEFEGSTGCPVALGVNVSGSGLVTSQPGGISCGPVCSALFPAGASVVLSASLLSGSKTVTWFGCDSITTGTSNTCTVVMNTARQVSAIFQ